MTNLTLIKSADNFKYYREYLSESEISVFFGYTIITGYNKNNQPVLFMFRPRALKPFVKSAFGSVEKLVNYAANIVDQIKKEDMEKQERAAKAKIFDVKNVISVNDVLYESWGYDQTNVEFYQVIKIKSRTQIVVRQVRSIMSNHLSHGMACYVDPAKDDFYGDERVINVRSSGSSDGWSAKAGRQYLYKYDGRSKYCSWYA